MSDRRMPRERLDALLTGLEDDVLQADQFGGRLSDEGVATPEVGAMRATIESVIHGQLDAVPGVHESGPEAREGAKGKVAQSLVRLGRWAGVRQGTRAAGAQPQVRMAFSGEGSDKRGESERSLRQRRTEKDPDPGGDKDR